ncbi:MAG: hypothetical protein H6999_01415 [Hahellaceae bacterium]|nr:hypothetical protein [Hahellaceae bacterium]MCP5168411.1 hypothetical protein [Hahellaceae bacterium]
MATDINLIRDHYLQHQQRHNAAYVAKLLVQLMILYQRHRASCMATLAGDTFFERQANILEHEIAHQMQAIEQSCHDYFQDDELERIQQEWEVLCRQWRFDSALDNFKLHSHLISRVLQLLWLLAERGGHMNASAGHQALAQLCMKHLPELIEAVAQARGLATHCAAIHQNEAEAISRIRYQINHVSSRLNWLNDAIVECTPEIYHILNALLRQKDPQKHLHIFLNQLESCFFNSETPTISSSDIFALGSSAISGLQDLLICGQQLLRQDLSSELKQWISGKSIAC